VPVIAIEVARRAIPGHVRPSFPEVEQAIKGGRRQRLENSCYVEWAANHHRKKESRTRSASRRSLEGSLRGFVTAMMALFIVLWLLNTSKQIQEAIGGYFKDPSGTSKKVGTNLSGSGENFSLTKDNMPKAERRIAEVDQMNNVDKLKSQIEMTVTSEGLRVELLESENGAFSTAAMRSPARWGKSS